MCGFEHEHIDYISRSACQWEINKEMYQRILQCILDGKCEHADHVPQEYVEETRVYRIHIAVAAGTITALKEFRVWNMQPPVPAYRWLYQIDPYLAALAQLFGCQKNKHETIQQLDPNAVYLNS